MFSASVKNFRYIALFIGVCAVSVGAYAQSVALSDRVFETSARAAEADLLVAGQNSIRLWGVQAIDSMPARFIVASRSALDNVVGSGKIRCSAKSRNEREIVAQCTSSNDIDLGLYMLQQGYVIADRSVIYGGVFEDPYLQAEQDAQSQELGIWAGNERDIVNDDKNFMITMSALLLMALLSAFFVLALSIMRGFKRVTDSQNQNLDMISRERELRNKERSIIAAMLDSEIKENKSKIEAYLAVYDEMLKDIQNTDREPKYRVAGDIVQAQPSLDRSVFDRNTDKLDVLGDVLSSKVVHFYARIKSKPDYIDLKPEDRIEVAKDVVEKALENAERLNKIADHLIDLFDQGGHSTENV